MMNKTRSARVHLLRFLFLLPLLVVVLLAFRNSTQWQQQPLREPVTDTLPKAAKEPPGLKEIATIDVTDYRKVTIRLKNGKVEHYDLMITKEREAFERKYGGLPEPPEPSALPAQAEKALPPVTEAPEKIRELPEVPEKPEAVEAPEKPEQPEAPEKAEMPEQPEAPERAEAPEAPVPPPPAPVQVDCHNKKGYCITVADNNGERIVIVKNKNGKIVEAIPLTDWNKDKQYEDKYGPMPVQPVKLMLKPVVSTTVKPKVNVHTQTVTVTDLTVAKVNYTNPKTLIKLEPLNITISNGFKEGHPLPAAKPAVQAKPAAAVKVTANPAPVAKPVPANPDQKL